MPLNERFGYTRSSANAELYSPAEYRRAIAALFSSATSKHPTASMFRSPVLNEMPAVFCFYLPD